MNSDTQLASVINNLKLPPASELAPWLKKLLDNPGSVVLIAIEFPLRHNGPLLRTAWLSEPERVKVRKALLAINRSRFKKDQPQTGEIPS